MMHSLSTADHTAGLDGVRGVCAPLDADEPRHDLSPPGLWIYQHLLLQIRHR